MLKYLSIIMIICSMFIMSCRVNYVEQEVKGGSVPPPAETVKIDPSDPYAASPYDSQKTTQATDDFFTQDDSEIITGKSNIIQNFKQQYAAKRSPRMAIYLNKELSDEVLEWKRYKRTTNYEYSATKTDLFDPKHVEAQGSSTTEVKSRNDLYNSRPQPGEGWMWDFEDGFYHLFLENGAHIIDRALMMRLIAAQNKETADTSRREIEIKSLENKADILIEILIRKKPRSKLGYQFKATAKDVRTAAILAVANSSNWEERLEARKGKYVASDQGGYELDQQSMLPTVPETSRYLAFDMMDALTEYWEQHN